MSDSFQQQFVEMLVTGAGYIYINLPRVTQKAADIEGTAAGSVPGVPGGCRSEDILDWEVDETATSSGWSCGTSHTQSKKRTTERRNKHDGCLRRVLPGLTRGAQGVHGQ